VIAKTICRYILSQFDFRVGSVVLSFILQIRYWVI